MKKFILKLILIQAIFGMPLELLSKDVFPSFANQPIEEAYKYLTNLNEFPFLTDGKDIDVAEVIGNIYEN